MPSKDRNRPRGTRRAARGLALAAAASLLCLLAPACVAVASSSASASDIEGVWAFNGGEIAVQKTGEGKYEGTVVTATAFAECVHPVGQEIWREITLQSDGSFWGFHQWYVSEGGKCLLDPEYVGPTAWRVLATSSGQRSLEVCFSRPGSSQPLIAADGTASEDTYGCSKSALTAPLSTSSTASFKLVSGLPSTRQCLSLRSFMIHVHDPRNDAFKSVTIALDGKHLKAVRKGVYLVARVNLRGLPKGTFTLRITGVTVQGRHLKGSRTYHTCTPGHKSTSHSR